MELTTNQQSIFERVEHESSNFFITGKPGVGKSVLINTLVSEGRKTYTLAAPTGLAALNIGGHTLHSIFRIPIFDGIIEPDYNQFVTDDRTVNRIKHGIKHLIIDEISMVRADIFDYIDRLLRFVKRNEEPFGGIQIIIVGDFFQLPPVSTPMHKAQLYKEGYESPFAFSSFAFKHGNFQTLELSEVLRQKGDPKFIKLLHSARTGDVTMEQCGTLNKNIGVVDDFRIMLCGANKQADLINQQHLNKIEEEATTYTAIKYGEWPVDPVEKELKLKIGAQVMIKQNGADRPPGDYDKDFKSKVVNGTLATIIDFLPSGGVHVELENSEQVIIYIKRWERKIKEKINDKWEERVVASFEQMPLTLAWAISIHKSQGQSFDKVHIDPSRIFETGQLYVGLSRCRSLKGLKFSSSVTTKKFFANESVKRFYKQLK